MHKQPFCKSLYVQVIFAIVVGVLLGNFYPESGTAMKPLGDGFIKLIKMIIAPVIFCTVVIGIAGMEDMKKVGKTGGLALLYFEIMSTSLVSRPDHRQRFEAWRGHECRCQHTGYREYRELYSSRQTGNRDRLFAAHYSGQHG